MILSGKSFWAKLETPMNNFDPSKPQWSIDVCQLDSANKKIAQDQGMTLKNKSDDRGDYVTIKRNASKANGSPNSKPRLIDGDLNSMEGVLIGNGSDVHVSFKTFPYKRGPVAGKNGFDLSGVQVINLIAYSGGNGVAVETEEFERVPNSYTHQGTSESISFE